MQLERMLNESDLDYHKRLVYGKLVDKTLADCDYTELAPYVYGKEYAPDVCRRLMYGSRFTLDLMQDDAESKLDNDVLTELELKRIELEKEKQKFYDQRTAFKKLIRSRSRQEELNEIITAAVNSGDLPSLEVPNTHDDIEYCNNDLLVSLNDIHYGAVVDNYWMKYNPDICKQMFEKYLCRILEIQKIHKSQNCYVFCNGDEISGNIHHSITVTNKEDVIHQVIGVSELISDFLAKLSVAFEDVYFVSVAGNHSRLNPNKDMALPSERLDDLIGWYAAARLQNLTNVHINAGEKIDNTMYLIDIRGKTYCGVHGDHDGTASKVQALQTMAGRPVYAILSGHMHHNETNIVQGIKTVMAGSFLGMDDFCVQKRIYGSPEQMVCVCDSDGIVCHYDVKL